MKEVLITFADRASPDYPLAVIIVTDGKRGQETTCRSMREARIYANGVCFGGRAAGMDWPINPVIDPRLIEV
jgi:hypothetical protein